MTIRRGSGGKDDAEDDLRAYGATDEQVAEILGEGPDDHESFGIWPENERAVICFIALQTQWRAGPLGGFLGLDYQGVHAGLRMMKIKDVAGMFADLRAMESAALPLLNQKAGDV